MQNVSIVKDSSVTLAVLYCLQLLIKQLHYLLFTTHLVSFLLPELHLAMTCMVLLFYKHVYYSSLYKS